LVIDADNCAVHCDEYTLSQIFANLLDNAIKYTEKGEVKIIISADKDAGLVCSISDTGIGMSNEFLGRVFEPFTQEEQGYTRKFEGNGLGLALVKEYCDLNKIEISLKSEKGEGTVFSLRFRNS
jgi:signal transduction histidine kinase